MARPITIIAICVGWLFGNGIAHTVSLPPDLKDAAATVQTVKTGLTAPEGPGCDAGGVLYFCDYGHYPTDTTGGIVYKLSGLQANPWVQGLNVPAGLVFDRQNRAIVSCWHKVLRITSPTQIDTLCKGADLRDANDLTLTSAGGIFFTSNFWDSAGAVQYLAPDGTVTPVLSFPGKPNAVFPNGIEYVEEKKLLYVSQSQLNLVKKYAVDNQHNVTTPVNFVTSVSPDGLALDIQYNVWLANGADVSVFDSSGTKLGSVTIDGGGVTNCCFGGSDRQTLYITAGKSVYSLHTAIKGRKTTGELPTGVTAPYRGHSMNSATGRSRKSVSLNASDRGRDGFRIDGATCRPAAEAASVMVRRSE